ncbi:MAG: GGDEF domain-containing protein [Bdellovibrionales bacterium]
MKKEKRLSALFAQLADQVFGAITDPDKKNRLEQRYQQEADQEKKRAFLVGRAMLEPEDKRDPFIDLVHEQAKDITKTRRLATRDHLTGVFNRRTFEEMANKSWAASKRTGDPVFVMMFDLDHFKSVNDTYGHAAGDHVLKKTAKIIDKTLRKSDVFARWGGEEFIACGSAKPPESSRQNITALADRVREAIEKTEFNFEGKTIPVTTSIGVAIVDPSTTSLLEAQQKADNALYEAKHNGRNRAVIKNLAAQSVKAAPDIPTKKTSATPNAKQPIPQ